MAARNVILWFLSRKARAAAEAESRRWIATCPGCGRKSSVWDLGGLRYKARGNPLVGYRCRGCGKFGLHRVAKQD